MSLLEVNKITPQSGTTLTLGDTGDTINFGSGVLPNFENLTVTGDLTVDTNSLKVDSANNRVGIGTASPTVALDVVGAITATGNITGTLATAAQPNITSVGTLTSATVSGDLTVDTNTLYVDSTNNRVGIGTTSPSSPLHIAKSSTGIWFQTERTDAGGFFTISHNQQKTYFNSDQDYIWSIDGSEAMRIDSSGNWMVGKTSVDLNVAGVEFRAGSYNAMTNNGGVPLYLNRLTSDGGILEFRKDDTTVGSIATLNSTLVIGSGDTGLLFSAGDDVVIPRNSSTAARDNAISLGDSGNRFKDLYLGGSVYVGGTGSANALDDYEEGTWTPSTGGVESVGTLSSAIGEYTKIGNVVYIRMTFDVGTNFVGSTITGLPFTVGGNNTVSSFYPASVMTDNSLNNQILPNFQITTTNVVFKEDDTNGNAHNPNTTNNIYRVCGFYFVN